MTSPQTAVEVQEAWRRDRDAQSAARLEVERERLELRNRLERAKVVATHWRDEALAGDSRYAAFTSHPCSLILAALQGEADPWELGIDPDSELAKLLP